jgi:glycosyltransferase involved in cell wall biosynthesis
VLLGIDATNIHSGGGVTHLSKVLAAQEHDGKLRVVLWASAQAAAHYPRRDWLQVITPSQASGSRLSRQYWQARILPQLLAAQGCDALFSPGGTLPGSAPPQCKLVTMSQNMLPFLPRERRRYGLSGMRLRLHLLELAQARSFRQADGVLFLTEYARQVVARRLGGLTARSAIVPHGIEERFRCRPRPQESIAAYNESRPFRLLYVSIVDQYKHQALVAAAVARLRRQGLPVTIDFVGPAYPPAGKKLAKVLRRLDPEGCALRYLGAVPHGELHDIYHAADAFVFASSCENLPNILLEAMAAGLPIACSDRRPMPDVLGEAGVYFNPEDTASIAGALEQLVLDVSLRERCAHLAFATSSHYTWERCAQDTFDFLKSVAQGAAPPREQPQPTYPVLMGS